MLEKASISLYVWRTTKPLHVLIRKNCPNLIPWKLLGCQNLGMSKSEQPFLRKIGFLPQVEDIILVVQTWSLQFSNNYIFYVMNFIKLVTIDCQQHVGNESCQSSVGTPYNMKKVENYDPSERENDVHDIDVHGSSSRLGDILVSSDDLWHSLEILDESSLDGEVGK